METGIGSGSCGPFWPKRACEDFTYEISKGGALAKWLACWTGLQIMYSAHALVRVIVLCSWARHFNLTVPQITQEYMDWANLTKYLL